MKIWLTAIKNCLKRGIKALIVAVIATFGLIGVAIGIVLIISLAAEGIAWVLGPTVCAAINNFFEKSALWIVVGFMGLAILIVGVDSVISEKKSLEWRGGDGVCDE